MEILDILILGSGPAALCLASELAKQDLNIKGISTKSPNEKWENTYGIWASELEELGLHCQDFHVLGVFEADKQREINK